MKTELIATMIRLGILLITGFIAPAFKAWLQQKAEDSKLERIKDWARMAVSAAEQAYKDYAKTDPHGTERMRLAKRVLAGFLSRAKITLSDSELNAVIESAVVDLNLDKKMLEVDAA